MQLTYTENHWADVQTTEAYLKEVVFPYIENTKSKNQISPDQKALLIWDLWYAHLDTAIIRLVKEKNIIIKYVPGNLTNQLQPIDISVNKVIKAELRNQYSLWLTYEFNRQLGLGVPFENVVLKPQWKVIKEIYLFWIAVGFLKLDEHNGQAIKNGFLAILEPSETIVHENNNTVMENECQEADSEEEWEYESEFSKILNAQALNEKLHEVFGYDDIRLGLKPRINPDIPGHIQSLLRYLGLSRVNLGEKLFRKIIGV